VGFFFWLLVLVFLDLLMSFDDTIVIRFDDFDGFCWFFGGFWIWHI
jgi:hypothetical protein